MTRIAPTDEEAVKEHNNTILKENQKASIIYTDGSGIDGKVGAAAKQMRGPRFGTTRSSKAYIEGL
jgi:hypothetical protein